MVPPVREVMLSIKMCQWILRIGFQLPTIRESRSAAPSLPFDPLRHGPAAQSLAAGLFHVLYTGPLAIVAIATAENI